MSGSRGDQTNIKSLNVFRTLGAIEEGMLRGLKHWPQYKYAARPLYKMFGGKYIPLFSVPATFVAMDYLFHQVLPKLIVYAIFTQQIPLKAFIPKVKLSCLWALGSIPVAIHKYKQLNENNARSPNYLSGLSFFKGVQEGYQNCVQGTELVDFAKGLGAGKLQSVTRKIF